MKTRDKSMAVTFWGTRGSIAVSGDHVARHGGQTTCLEVEFAGGAASGSPERIIVDGGTGIAALARAKASSLTDVLVYQTHMHWDHVQGFPFFGPLFNPAARIAFCAVEREDKGLIDVLDDQMQRPTFPVTLDMLPATLTAHALDPEGSTLHGDVQVQWTELCHPSGSTGYRFTWGGRSIVFTGDVEVRQGCADELVEFARGADVLIMDAQYFPDEYAQRVGFGHSTPLDAVEIAARAGVPHLVMTHHDPAHDDDTLDRKLELAREHALVLTGNGLRVDNAADGMRLELDEPDILSLGASESTPDVAMAP